MASLESSFRRRMLIAPGVGLLFLLVLNALVFKLLEQQDTFLSHIVEDDMTTIVELDAILSELAINHAALHDALIDVNELASEEEIYVKGKPILNRLFRLHRAILSVPFSPELAPIKNEILADTERTLSLYYSAAVTAIEMTTVRWQFASEHLEKADDHFSKVVAAMQQVSSIARGHLQGELVIGREQARTYAQFFTYISIGAIVVLLWLALFFSARLARNVQDVINTLTGLAAGNLNTKLPGIKVTDAMHSIVFALSSLRERLRQIDRLTKHTKEINIELEQENRQRKQAEGELRLAAKVFENTAEAVLITDRNNRIVAINRAYSEISGYTEEEALGKNPSILQSGRHDTNFYKDMWNTLVNEGTWQGEIWNRRKDGETWPNWLTISVVDDEDTGERHYVAVFADISVIKDSQAQIEYMASHDPLTELPNRALLMDRLNHAMERGRRDKGRPGLLFIDLDRFKNVNDTLGHPIGDDLLVEVANRLNKLVRKEDTVARLGGDEFVVLIEDPSGPEALEKVASKILDKLSRPMLVAGHELILTTSIGVAMYPNDGEDTTTLVKNADAAMYEAKNKGKNRFCFYTQSMTEVAESRLRLESDLRRALEKGEFVLHYQPQVSLLDNHLIGCEALIRWQHPQRGMVPPDEFIGLAEEIGEIEAIGEWVARETLRQCREWQKQGLKVRMAINLSVRQLLHPEFIDSLSSLLKKECIDSSMVELEVTESIFLDHSDQCINALNQLRALGPSLAIDDFGTGYSSLSYLKRLPIQRIKIDRSFVQGIPGDRDDTAIAEAVIAMANTMDLEVVAEGVETEEQLIFLSLHGCSEAQGYHFSKPFPAEEFFTWAKNMRVVEFEAVASRH